MDLTNVWKDYKPNRRTIVTWVLSSGLRRKFVLVARDRLMLVSLAQHLARPESLAGLVTCEAAALQRIAQHQPGMLMCTDQLEQGNVYSLIKKAKQLVPDLRMVLFLCDQTSDVRRALDLGVEGILLEQEIGEPGYFGLKAFLSAIIGKRYVSPGAEVLLNSQSREGDGIPLRLTPREEDILTLIIAGSTDRQIAEQLGLSADTVRGYIKEIRRKFGVKSKIELLGKVLQGVMRDRTGGSKQRAAALPR
jgi:two-component system, NarL family, nitrate/nitrite response regulator NarL